NSGVILSQIVRGSAEALAEPGPIDGAAVARALRAGADAAYRAVREPVEGTMLTAIRVLSETAEAEGARPVPELLELLVMRGEEAVASTQEQLDILREAGVVVAGVGNRRLFESLGATQIVEGGQTMNPPTADLVAAIEATKAPEAIVLPNNPNVALAAEQAVSLAPKPAAVVRTESIQAGLAA